MLVLVVMGDFELVLRKMENVNYILVTMLLSPEPILPMVVSLETLESRVIRHWSGDGDVLVSDDDPMLPVVLLFSQNAVVLVAKIIILFLLLVCVLWVIRKKKTLVERCLRGNVAEQDMKMMLIVMPTSLLMVCVVLLMDRLFPRRLL